MGPRLRSRRSLRGLPAVDRALAVTQRAVLAKFRLGLDPLDDELYADDRAAAGR
jgi:hypothetical protein